MMALSRSPELKKFRTQHLVQQSFLVPKTTIWANSEELNFAILCAKFQESEPSCSETEDFFHIAYEFLCFKPKSPWRKAIWTLRPRFEQTW